MQDQPANRLETASRTAPAREPVAYVFDGWSFVPVEAHVPAPDAAGGASSSPDRRG